MIVENENPNTVAYVFDRGRSVKFNLTYEGVLNPTGNSTRAPRADHKQEIRKHFHTQLKRFWERHPVAVSLGACEHCNAIHHWPIADSFGIVGHHKKVPLVDFLPDQFPNLGYRFCPLVCGDFELTCHLRITILTNSMIGQPLKAGDLDNRIKTLIDALRMPRQRGELGQYETPAEGEDPFFCLLQDDQYISEFEVVSDVFYGAPEGFEDNDKYVHSMIEVTLRPYIPTTFNLSFS